MKDRIAAEPRGSVTPLARGETWTGRGDDHLNRGRLGPKRPFGWQANGSSDRLTRPLLRGDDGRLHEPDWETARVLVG